MGQVHCHCWLWWKMCIVKGFVGMCTHAPACLSDIVVAVLVGRGSWERYLRTWFVCGYGFERLVEGRSPRAWAFFLGGRPSWS